jgi:transposase
MARYKHIDTSPRLLPVDLRQQMQPGTFEHALDYLLDHLIDLQAFDAEFGNDETGAPAYPPAVLLKVVLFAYSRGLVSSRSIARACREQVTFIALSGDTQPHFTTIARFISTLGDNISQVFTQVLYLCDQQNLIGREMFAIDGVKLPCNAAKAKSGTRAEFAQQADKLEAAAKAMLQRHREADALAIEPDIRQKEHQRIARLEHQAAQLRQWLADHPEDKVSAKGALRKSNRTDNDSAKMATSKGVIQGYTGVASVDSKHQIIVNAQAYGSGSEHALLLEVVDALKPQLQPDTLLTADAGYHSESNLKQLAERKINALIADNGMRQRDERFTEQAKHKNRPDPLHNKSAQAKPGKLFRPADFTLDEERNLAICPAGKQLYSNGQNCTHNGKIGRKFSGAKRDCEPCSLRDKCLRHPDKTPTRQVTFFYKDAPTPTNPYTAEMRRRIDSPEGRSLYGQRFATVEPVFGNLRHNKRLNRFTLRGKDKVNAQWQLFCLVHNIEKLSHHPYQR